MTLKHLLLTAVAVSLLALSACTNDSQDQVANPDEANPETYVTPGSIDEQFLQIEERVPGFAGLFYNDAQQVVVNRAADSGLEVMSNEAIKDAITNVMGDELFLDAELGTLAAEQPLKVATAKYSFSQLNTYRNYASELLSQEGTEFIDADEAINKVVIGVSSKKLMETLPLAASELGIPDDAITFELSERTIPTASINDSLTTIPGGAEIGRNGSYCTLGFNVRNGSRDLFVLNSHCAGKQGTVESTPFYQDGDRDSADGVATGNYIGFEIRDPSYKGSPWPWVCPIARVCRRSDSALGQYATTTARTRQIAGVYTSSSAPGRDHLFSNTWPVTGVSAAVKGMVVRKVGASTGLSEGKITRTCAGTNYKNGTRNYHIKCSLKMGLNSEGGDSGAPIVRVAPNGNATAIGLQFAKSGSSAWGSPISSVNIELGITSFDYIR